MSKEETVGNQPTDQHYYHFVVARDRRGYTLDGYWSAVAQGSRALDTVWDGASEKMTVQHRRLELDRAYAGGQLRNAISRDGNGQAPYAYDLFGLKFRTGGATFFAFGFPFSEMAQQYVDRLLSDHALLRSVDLQRVDIGSLVRCCEVEGAVAGEQGMQMQVVGVQFVVVGDSYLSAVTLSGDDPLSARIYKDRLKGDVAKRYLSPDHCVLLCEQPAKPGRASDSGGDGSLRARLHVDTFGNFKCYTHKMFANIPIVGRSIATLQMLGCLDKTAQNPLHRISPEDEEA